MDHEQRSAIHNFAASRMGRLRYVTYTTTLFAVPVLPALLLCMFHDAHNNAYMAGIALLGCSVVFYAVLSARRIIDLGCTGWWATVPVCAYLWLLKKALYAAHPPTIQFYFYTLAAPGLCNAAIFILLASIPGKSNENRFGPPPLPGAMPVKAIFATSIFLCLGWISIPVIKHNRYQQMLQQSVDDALMRASATEIPFRDYYRSHKPWPESIGSSFPAPIPSVPGLIKEHLWIWLSPDRSTLIVEAPLLRDGQISIAEPPPGVAVWTTDNGETWHCGPYVTLPDILPESCRDSHTPRYPYHLPM